MKKLLLIVICLFLIPLSSHAQKGIKLGAHVGLPGGDVSDYTNFQAGADVAYLFKVIPTVQVGPLVGYSRFFSEDLDLGLIEADVFEDPHFMPIAASGRVDFMLVMLGADLGYAIGLNDGNEGGLYLRPKVGLNLLGLGVIVSYTSISRDGSNMSSVNLGVEFGL